VVAKVVEWHEEVEEKTRLGVRKEQNQIGHSGPRVWLRPDKQERAQR